MRSRVLVMGVAMAWGWCGAVAQDPVKAYPNNYKLVMENDSVAVIRVHYGPHEKVGVHDHSNYPTIYVYLSDSGPVKFEHSEEKPFTTIRPPAVTGAFRVAPARPERHTVENLGDISTDFLRIELKQVPLSLRSPFRGEAPQSVAEDLDKVEFEDGGVEVEQMVCAGTADCAVKAAAPSIVVAITPVELKVGGKTVGLKAGEVYSLAGAAPASMLGHPGVPSHLLRVVVPAKP